MLALTQLALLGRILLMGIERPLVKMLGTQRSSVEVAFLFFSIATVMFFPFAAFRPVPSWDFLRYLVPAGILYTIAFICYVRALSDGEVSLVAPLASFNVLFLFLLAVPVLGESFTLLKLLGIALIFLGTSFLSDGNPFHGLRHVFKDRACILMLVSTLLVAVGRIIDKSAAADPLTYSLLIYFLISLLMFLYLLVKGRARQPLALFRERPVIALACGFTNAYAYLLLLVVIQTMEVSIAEPATNLSLLLAVFLGKVFFRENIRGRVFSAAAMIAGVWVLILG
ncbi:MAG: DMT family transporter [Bacillota bacterium]|nr:DMT family transporter [Bacillota bacterium]MDW7684162.1 DMT family transporter [Bacillota bacterium]